MMKEFGLKKRVESKGYKSWIDKLVLEQGGGRVRWGRTLFFQDDLQESMQKAMIVELTPRKEHVRVATKSSEKPVIIGLDRIREPPPQPLDGWVFVISGNLTERGDKKKINTEELTKLNLKNGGNVYNGNVEKALNAEFILITSQKEVDKDHLKTNKAITMAYRLGWPIVSKQFVLNADEEKECPDISKYQLNLSKMKQAPLTALGKAVLVKANAVVDVTKKHSAHQEMKRKLLQKKSRKRSEESQKEAIPKHPPKKACSGYVTYSCEQFPLMREIHPRRSFKDINRLISNSWNALDNEVKKYYVKRGKENHKKRLERWQARVAQRL